VQSRISRLAKVCAYARPDAARAIGDRLSRSRGRGRRENPEIAVHQYGKMHLIVFDVDERLIETSTVDSECFWHAAFGAIRWRAFASWKPLSARSMLGRLPSPPTHQGWWRNLEMTVAILG